MRFQGWPRRVAGIQSKLPHASTSRGREKPSLDRLADARLLVVRREMGGDSHTRAVRVEIGGHVVGVHLHVGAELVERRRRDHVAPAIDLPGDGRVARAHLVVALRASRRACVLGHILAVGVVDHHALEQVGVVVGLVVDDGERLRLHADLLVRVERRDGDDPVVAEDAVVEGRLHLPLRAARAGGRMRPVDLVRLADLHVDAVLPVVLVCELDVRRSVVVAAVAEPDRVVGTSETAAR
mmetsp:Transcript_45511/g.119564  ORF Transcript_45511/g.119564 Transcript_45511/m.119564 type:complete len:239 (-) Transcript_45511:23-739(-)